MITKLVHVTLWVKDQDEALDFYANQLGFTKKADDSSMIPGYRWLTVAPKEQTDVEIVLGLAHSPETQAQVGKAGTWVLHTDDCRKEYETLKARGVKFTQAPKDQPYGVEALFEDLYGNSYDLLQPRQWQPPT